MPMVPWIRRAGAAYLILPALLFAIGWLRAGVGILLALLLVAGYWSLARNGPAPAPEVSARYVLTAAVVAGIWVLLSGIGGFAFQNWDHHWRNAVFHDLVDRSWPVVYAAPETGPIRVLVYNVGFWLPAASLGRVLGWQAANAMLFLWTWLGTFLVLVPLLSRFRWPAALALPVFFSGLDAVGAALYAQNGYPTLWPPISHLEAWASEAQYSSFTTQLFWVFNQAVPAWLCITLGLEKRPVSGQLLLWGLCFFYAPLPALGWLPLAAAEMYYSYRRGPAAGIRLLRSLLTPGTAAAMGLIGVSAAYFASNTAAHERAFRVMDPRTWLAFVVLEVGLYFLVLYREHRHDLRWYVALALLLGLPFLQVGAGNDLVMRASIPALFYLMIWCGELLADRQGRLPLQTERTEPAAKDAHAGPPARVPRTAAQGWQRWAVLALLAVGSLGPLYEINRSIYRTAIYYLVPSSHAAGTAEPVDRLGPAVVPEYDHPGRLEADALTSLAAVRDQLAANFVGSVRGSLFWDFLADR